MKFSLNVRVLGPYPLAPSLRVFRLITDDARPLFSQGLSLPERSIVLFDAIQAEFGSANIHVTCRSLHWALCSHWPVSAGQHLRLGPGHSGEGCLHALVSAKWEGGLELFADCPIHVQYLGFHPI